MRFRSEIIILMDVSCCERDMAAETCRKCPQMPSFKESLRWSASLLPASVDDRVPEDHQA